MNRTLRLASVAALAAVLLSACAAEPGEPVPSTAAAVSAPPSQQESSPAPLVSASPKPAASQDAVEGTHLVAGEDYVVIPNGRPYLAQDGKFEVVEVFGYVCPACASFHPLVSSWVKTLPADVAFRYVPAPFGRDWAPYARGFYVADAMGLVPRTHDALINAIHVQHSMPGEGQSPTDEAIAKFYAGFGANEERFLSQMKSFATETKMRRGRQFIAQSGVEGTPTLIVDGKYRVLGRSWQDSLRIADQLVIEERQNRPGSTGK